MDEPRASQLQPEEVAFLEAIAAKLSPEASQRLRADVQIACVTRDSDFLNIDLPGYERPKYRGHRNLPFEGRMRAADGGAMTVLVNMDQNDRLLEVEFIRWESLSSVDPDWSTLRIAPEPPTGVAYEW